MRNGDSDGVGMAVGPAAVAHFPSGGALRAALGLALRAPSAGNSQPWRWGVDDGVLQLRAEPPVESNTDPQRRDVVLSCGAALHHCVVALAATGWRAHVSRLPDAADPALMASMTLDAQPSGDLDRVLSAAIPQRRSDRRRFGDAAVPWGDIAMMGARAARAGVMLRQVDRGASLCDQPPGSVVVLGTEDDDEMAQLRAGEVTSLVLLSATAMGLASCAVTEPLAVPETRDALRADVFGDSGHPQIMVRLGRPADGVDPLPPTPRRPLPEVSEWMFPKPPD